MCASTRWNSSRASKTPRATYIWLTPIMRFFHHLVLLWFRFVHLPIASSTANLSARRVSTWNACFPIFVTLSEEKPEKAKIMRRRKQIEKRFAQLQQIELISLVIIKHCYVTWFDHNTLLYSLHDHRWTQCGQVFQSSD